MPSTIDKYSLSAEVKSKAGLKFKAPAVKSGPLVGTVASKP